MDKSTRPNILVIVADDLGFSDLSCFGSEIPTPNLDELGRTGIRFTDFHTAAQCAPTRAMLMTGTDHHLTGLGQLPDTMEKRPRYRGQPGHEGYMTHNVATLPEVLQDNGYHTVLSGKWHLGLSKEYAPCSRGFTKSFTHLPGASNHFGWEPDATEEEDNRGTVRSCALHMEDDQYFDNSNLPDNYYSTDYYTDRLIGMLEDRPKDQPIFAYLAYTAVHWPLQAPRESIEKFKGRYDEGPDVLRDNRLASLKREKLIPDDVIPHPVIAPDTLGWTEMNDLQRAKSARTMEVYAGMVYRIDQNIGKLIQYMKANDLYDNTQILFLSDNGAEGVRQEASGITSGDVFEHIKKYFDNSLDNIGNKTSFVWYGTRWAQAATAPSRLHKSFSTEGGIRVPLIFKPAQDWTGFPSISHEFGTVMDFMPTFLDQAGAAYPESKYKGREVEPMRGRSWVPFFSGQTPHIHDEDHVVGWELIGQGALRKGNWKINHVNKPKGPERWQLYDLSKDPGEVEDLAETHKAKLQELLKDWEHYAKETNIVGLTPDFDGVVVDTDMGDPTWWMEYEKYSTSKAAKILATARGIQTKVP